MTGRLGDDLDLPFEEVPGGAAGAFMTDLDDALVCGGLVVMGGVLPVPGIGPKPALVFRFATATGDLANPVVLVLDADQAAKTTALVDAAVNASLKLAEDALRNGTFGSGR